MPHVHTPYAKVGRWKETGMKLTPPAVLAATALLVGCASEEAEAAPCDDATEAAHTAHDAATDAFQRMKAVREQPVDPSLSTEVPEAEEGDTRFQLSPHTEAKMEAGAQAAGERTRLHDEAQRQTRKWATIIEQNPNCFKAEARANAAEALRQSTEN